MFSRVELFGIAVGHAPVGVHDRVEPRAGKFGKTHDPAENRLLVPGTLLVALDLAQIVVFEHQGGRVQVAQQADIGLHSPPADPAALHLGTVRKLATDRPHVPGRLHRPGLVVRREVGRERIGRMPLRRTPERPDRIKPAAPFACGLAPQVAESPPVHAPVAEPAPPGDGIPGSGIEPRLLLQQSLTPDRRLMQVGLESGDVGETAEVVRAVHDRMQVAVVTRHVLPLQAAEAFAREQQPVQ